MGRLTLLLAFSSWTVHGQQMRPPTLNLQGHDRAVKMFSRRHAAESKRSYAEYSARRKIDPMKAFAMLLLTWDPMAFNPSGAFYPSCTRAHCITSHKSTIANRNHVRNLAPAMNMSDGRGMNINVSEAPVLNMTTEEKREDLSAFLGFALEFQDFYHNNVGQVFSEEFSEIRDRTHVAPSSRNGLGLFASTDIEENAIATFFPVSTVGLGNEPLVAHDSNAGDFVDHSRDHRFTIDVTSGLWLQPNLKSEDLQGWLGHRSNDAAFLDGTSEAEIFQYLEDSARDCNCVVVPFGNAPPLTCLLTTRPIKEGEELFTHYGFMHWITRMGGNVTADVEASGWRNATSLFEGLDWDGRISKLLGRYKFEVKNAEEVLATKWGWPPDPNRPKFEVFKGFGRSDDVKVTVYKKKKGKKKGK